MAVVDVVATGASTLIAATLASSEALSIDNVVLIDPWFFREDERHRLSASYAPKLMPGDYGQHLLEAWYYARDSELYWPWNEPHPENALMRRPDIEPEHVQARTVDVLKAGIGFPKLVREILSAEIERPFTAVAGEIVVCARAGNGHEARARDGGAPEPAGELRAVVGRHRGLVRRGRANAETPVRDRAQ